LLTCLFNFVSKNALQSTENTSKGKIYLSQLPLRVLRAIFSITEGIFGEKKFAIFQKKY